MSWSFFEPGLKYLIVPLAGFLLAWAVVPAVIRLAPRLGLLDLPGGRRIHSQPTPRGGGVAVFAGFHAACAVLFLAPWQFPFAGRLDMGWWLACLAASSWLLLGGLWDDRRGLPPLVKLGWQAGAGLLFVVLSGETLGGIGGCPLPPWADWLLTLLFFLLFINAFNLIDGMDGLATGLALLSGVAFAVILFVQRQPADVLVLLALAGPCAAFLRYNFHPARVFLGDSGSMFLGFVLAAVAVGAAQSASGLLAVLVPLLVAGIPMLDVLLAVWRRGVRGLAAGRPGSAPPGGGMMGADREHLHHRFLDRGFTQRQVALLLYGANLLLCLLALAILVVEGVRMILVTAAVVVAALLVARHVAQLEMWDSGQVVVRGLRRPPSRALPMILYPVLDAVWLAVTLLGSLGLGNWLAAGPATTAWVLPREEFILLAPVAVGVPFLFLVVAGCYVRVWSRARPWDFVVLTGALAAGFLVAAAVLQTGAPAAGYRPLLHGLLAFPFLLGIRLWSHLFRDLLCLIRPPHGAAGAPDNLLLVGGGWRCQLFLRERKSPAFLLSEGCRIVGILDDDVNLRGRRVYGYPVVGTLDEIHRHLDHPPIRTLVVLCHLGEERQHLLAAAARQHGLQLVEWRTEEGRPAWADRR
ncbi:MAG: hypothetical protein WC708_11440 [Lentisphaeria bacterium]